MSYEAEFSELLSFFNSFGLTHLPTGWQSRIRDVFKFITAANENVNLTRITSFNEFLVKHIADSLLLRAIVPRIGTQPLAIADVGCGAGFPGIPLALTFPESTYTEIDSNTKKSVFVETLIESLNLKNCNRICGRGRELARRPQFRGKFDIVLARAVKETSYLITECRHFVRQHTGMLVAYKTPSSIEKERAPAERMATKFRLQLIESPIFKLPDNFGERQFFLIKNPHSPESRLHRWSS